MGNQGVFEGLQQAVLLFSILDFMQVFKENLW